MKTNLVQIKNKNGRKIDVRVRGRKKHTNIESLKLNSVELSDKKW